MILLAACSGQNKDITKAEMDIRTIRMALIGYAMHDGIYPTTEQDLKSLIEKPNLPPIPTAWEGPYLEPERLVDPWGNKYIYHSPSTENPKKYKYDLYSHGPDKKVGGKDDITIRDIEKLLGK